MNSLPQWLKKRITVNEAFLDTKRALSEFSINTVCESSRCPNISECFSSRSVTFMILGTRCTRSCAFCSVKNGIHPEAIDTGEPERIADCVKRLGSGYVIVTSVTRDDLDDGGAGQFVRVVEAIRRLPGGVKIELLIPDLAGDPDSIKAVAVSGADIIGHNVETVGRLYPFVRKEADYSRSLDVLRSIKEASPSTFTKSAILAGLGETRDEVLEVMIDLRKVDCDILTIGQYLRPSKENYPVDRFVPPEEFESLKTIGEELGFKSVNSGTFVRSSYLAEAVYANLEVANDKCHNAAVS